MKYKWQPLDVYGYRLYRVVYSFDDGFNPIYSSDCLVFAENPNQAKQIVKEHLGEGCISAFRARAERVLMREDIDDLIYEREHEIKVVGPIPKAGVILR